MVSLDEIDRQLLDVLQGNNQLSAAELSQQIPLSPSAIMRRVRRLREEEVIAADVSVVSEALASTYLYALIRIQLERHAKAAVEKFRRSLVASPAVQMCLEVSGSFDVIILVTAPDMNSFNSFVDNSVADDAAVRRYETEFVKKRWKSSLAVRMSGHQP